jgi:hypothetical protein
VSFPDSQQPGLVLSRGSRAALFVACVLALAVFVSHHRLAATLAAAAAPRERAPEAYMLPEPRALQVIGLGHDEMMADLVWLRALSYFAGQFVGDRDFRWLDRYIETVIALDPNFRMIYEWAGAVVISGAEAITNERVHVANRFLEMGRQRYPDDWRLNFMLGCNYRFELRPANEEQEQAWRLLGGTYLRRAAELPDAPAWLSLTALRTLERYGADDEAVQRGIQAFLAARGQLSASLRAELELHARHPRAGTAFGLDLGSLIASGYRVRPHLASTDFWHLLAYRRLLYADTDTDSGYLPWELRALVRGEPPQRTRPEATPIDVAFAPSLRLMEAGGGFDDTSSP